MKKRLFNLLLMLTLIVIMVSLSVLTASAADYNVGGVKAVASEIKYNSGNGTYLPMFSSVTPVTTSGTNVTNAQGTAVKPLYKDFNGMSTLSNLLTTAPENGVTYYSRITMQNPNGNANIKKDYVNIEIEGYKTEYLTYSTGDGGFTVNIFYSVTKKAEPAGTIAEVEGFSYEVIYDSAKGGYVPGFDNVKIFQENNYVHQGYAEHTALYKSSTFSASQIVTAEPKAGDTCYFGVYATLIGKMNTYTYDLNSIKNNSYIGIAGYDVKFHSAAECDGGARLRIVYSAKKTG